MGILDELEFDVFQRTATLIPEQVTLRALYKTRMVFAPSSFDAVYQDTIVLARTDSGSGYCCCHKEDPEIPAEIIGRDIREIQTDCRALRIALLDAIYSSFNQTATRTEVLHGSCENKALLRAEIILQEMSKVSPRKTLMGTKIAIIGAVGSIISSLISAGANVSATDLDHEVIGTQMAGVYVEDGTVHTIPLVMRSDVALVKGVALSNGTLDAIFDATQRSSTALIVFAESGANFARKYVERGASVAIAEFFPNYLFPGNSEVKIFESEALSAR